MKKEELKQLAKEYIKDAHVIGLVHALEGGVLNLDDFLVDFLKYINSKKS